MSAFNKYLARAKALGMKDPLLSGAAHVVGGVVGVADRVVGHSARRLQALAHGVSRSQNGSPKRFGHLPDNKYSKRIKAMADKESRKSRNTRIVVGGAALGAAGANKQNTSNQTRSSEYDFAGYRSY